MGTLSARLKLKPGEPVFVPNAPAEVRGLFAGIATVQSPGPPASIIFARTRSDLKARVARLAVTRESLLWIAFPKKSSGLQTDLTMQEGWESLTRRGMRPVAMVSIDSTWAAVRFRPTSEVQSRSGANRFTGEAARYVDHVKKTVRIPPDLTAALGRHPAAAGVLEKMSYTHRKEYVEWIVSAVKPETRARRVQQAVERLVREARQRTAG